MQIYQFNDKIFLRNILIVYLHNFKIVMPKLYFIMVHEINTDEGVKDVKMLKRVNNNYFLTWISAQVKEMGGFVFRNCEIHFSHVFWVRNK